MPVERDVEADLPTLLPEVEREVAEGIEEWLRETEDDPVLEVAPALEAAPLLLDTDVPFAVLAVREAAEEFIREEDAAVLETEDAPVLRTGSLSPTFLEEVLLAEEAPPTKPRLAWLVAGIPPTPGLRSGSLLSLKKNPWWGPPIP